MLITTQPCFFGSSYSAWVNVPAFTVFGELQEGRATHAQGLKLDLLVHLERQKVDEARGEVCQQAFEAQGLAHRLLFPRQEILHGEETRARTRPSGNCR
jgi:hypothetical protein